MSCTRTCKEQRGGLPEFVVGRHSLALVCNLWTLLLFLESICIFWICIRVFVVFVFRFAFLCVLCGFVFLFRGALFPLQTTAF